MPSNIKGIELLSMHPAFRLRPYIHNRPIVSKEYAESIYKSMVFESASNIMLRNADSYDEDDVMHLADIVMSYKGTNHEAASKGVDLMAKTMENIAIMNRARNGIFR